MLGVGFDHEEGHIRITEADGYKVIMGSEDCHSKLGQVCQQIVDSIRASGHSLSDYTADELIQLFEIID